MVSERPRPARGDIWLVDFNPIRGSEQAGVRPALVFSSDRFQRIQDRLVIVMPMTSRLKRYPFHMTIQSEESGLDRAGAIMLDQIRTISTERLLSGHAIGHVSDATMTMIEERFRVLFDLS